MSYRTAAIYILSVIAAQAAGRQDVHRIVQLSVAANQKDWDAAPQYDHRERSRDKNGTRTYEVVMLDGSPYQRPLADNGAPLSADREKEELQKQAAELARRRAESPEQRAHRIGEYQAGRRRDHLLMEQLTAGMNFTFLREEQVGAYKCYVLRATPRPGYRPPNTQSQVLTAMQGKLWIDEDSHQWVKVEASVMQPVAIEGFLARVEPGTRFELEKRPVGGGLWFKSHFSMAARTKILLVFTYRSQEEDWYSNYRPSGSAAPPASATGSRN